VSKFGAVGYNADGRTVHGFHPPFDPSEGGLNWAEQQAADAEQSAVDAAGWARSLPEAAECLDEAARIAQGRGHRNAAAAYRRAAAAILAGEVGEARAALGWDVR
jgi:hypothetical protein